MRLARVSALLSFIFVTGCLNVETLHSGSSPVKLSSSNPPTEAAAPTPIRNIDFEKYTSTGQLRADCTTFNCVEDHLDDPNGTMSLDTTVGSTGLTKSMKYTYLHPGDGCNTITVGRQILFPREQQVWAEFVVRFSANFTTDNGTCYPNANKFIFGDTEADLSGRWALHVGTDTGPWHSVTVERPLAPASQGGMIGAYYMNVRRNLAAESIWDGNWHQIRLFYRNSTTPSSSDGAMKVWIDGVVTHDETGFNTMKPIIPDGGGAEFINGFSFSHNKDDGPPGVPMSVWWGSIKVWNANPGWN